MSGTFAFRIITPLRSIEREVTAIRLADMSGHFGILRGHADFLTVIPPGMGYYASAAASDVFFAVRGGVLRVCAGTVTLTAREFFENVESGELSEDIARSVFETDEAETVSARMLQGLQRMFMEKTRSFSR